MQSEVDSLNNAISLLKQQLAEAHHQNSVSHLNVEGVNEELKNDVLHTKKLLNEQNEKFEKLELQTRKLKQECRILEKFVRIEMRSPQDIMDEFRTGKMSDRQMLSGY